MYIDFDDQHPDTPRLEGSFTRREAVVYSVVFHALLLLAVIYVPEIPWVRAMVERARLDAEAQQRVLQERQRESPRFVFVQPRIDTPAPAAPPRAELSDQDRQARTVERAPTPTNSLPFSRGNSPDRAEAERQQLERPRGQGPAPEPNPDAERTASNEPSQQPEMLPPTPPVDTGRMVYAQPSQTPQRPNTPGGALGEALHNLQRYVGQDAFDNRQGGDGAFGPSIQFDTKGVEFGPWIRRFIAQIKRNWFIPYAAMSFKGHVVVTFNVHKDGSITDLNVLQPSSVDAFNSSAGNALLASNPTQPLPPEYPADKAFFTVTFYYNETPPSQ
jgi:TonB family protein